jgi:hypothetical protein
MKRLPRKFLFCREMMMVEFPVRSGDVERLRRDGGQKQERGEAKKSG